MSPWVLSVLLASLLINGCGGAKSTRATATSDSTPPATTATTTTNVTQPAPSTTTTTLPKTATTGPKATAGASNVRVPATFTITAHGTVSPPTISAPASVSVQLSVVSGDGHPHQVVLATHPSRSLEVSPHGTAEVLLAGLKNGAYALRVDGTNAGTLVIGSQPGP